MRQHHLVRARAGGGKDPTSNGKVSARDVSPPEEKVLAERWADARGRGVAFDRLCLLNEENAPWRATWAAKIADDASLPESRRNKSLQSTDGAMLDRLARSKLPTAEKAEGLAARLRDEAASGSGSQAAGIAVSGVPRVVGLVHSPGDTPGLRRKETPFGSSTSLTAATCSAR